MNFVESQEDNQRIVWLFFMTLYDKFIKNNWSSIFGDSIVMNFIMIFLMCFQLFMNDCLIILNDFSWIFNKSEMSF